MILGYYPKTKYYLKFTFIFLMFFFISCSKQHNQLRVNFDSNLIDVDPIKTTAFDWNLVFNQVFESLFTIAVNGEVERRMISKWDVNTDYTKFIFQLRKDLYFSNGEKLKAQDVINSFSIYSKNPKHELHELWKNLKMIKVLSAYELEMNFSNSFPDLIYYLSSPYSKIFKRSAKKEKKIQSILGSGPFKVVNLIPKKILILDKNKYYRKSTKLEKIIFKKVTVPLDAILNKELDFAELKRSQIKTIPKDKVFASSYPMLGNFMLGFNMESHAFKNLTVRLIIKKCIDRSHIVEGINISKNFIHDSIIPFGLKGYLKSDERFSLLEAKKLISSLSKSQLPKKEDMVIHVPEDAHPMGIFAINKINQGLISVGLHPLKIVEVKEDFGKGKIGNYYHFLRTRKFNLYIRGMIATIPSPLYIIKENILPEAPMNFSKYKNPKIEKYIDDLKNSKLDEETLLKKISLQIQKDIPFVMLGSLFYNPASRVDFPIKAHAISPNYINFAESI